MDKAHKLRKLLSSDKPIVIVGAHNGLSARLVEEAGFDGIWGSGFEISGSHAIPDANILTMAENLTVTKNINDSTTVPVIADCDNGYGNAINVMRMVEEYEKAGIAGVCIEDNVFPKRCSFYSSVKRELESVAEFAGKIRAAKRAQRNPDFVVIARTEALIAGWGMDEALKRGTAYAEAGADMVLIHSKKSSPQEILTFAEKWNQTTPLVCVPTTYNTASVEELHAAGYQMIIFANHGMRAAIKAMQETFAELRTHHRASAIDARISPMTEVYRLMGVDDLQANEAEYLPTDNRSVTAVIVAAGQGFEHELMPLIADRPKSLLEVKGKTILQRQIETLHKAAIRNIAVVRGYKKEMVAPLPDVRFFDNDRYAETNAVASFFCAHEVLQGKVIALYGDILFDESILEKLLKSEADVTLVVDHARGELNTNGTHAPTPDTTHNARPVSQPELVKTAKRLANPSRFVSDETLNSALKIGRKLDASEANAEFIGMVMFSARGIEQVKKIYAEVRATHQDKPFHEAATIAQASFSDLLQELIARDMEVACLDIYKGWVEVDTFEDYKKMWAEIDR